MSAPRTPEPRGRPAATTTAVLVALLLLVAGAALVVDATGSGGRDRSASVRWVLQQLDGLRADEATTAIGAGVVLVGLALVLLALRPRRRTHLPGGEEDLWLTPRAAGTLAAAEAGQHRDVLSARVASAGRRRVVLAVVPREVEPPPTLAASVRDAVVEAVPALRRSRVLVREEEG